MPFSCCTSTISCVLSHAHAFLATLRRQAQHREGPTANQHPVAPTPGDRLGLIIMCELSNDDGIVIVITIILFYSLQSKMLLLLCKHGACAHKT